MPAHVSRYPGGMEAYSSVITIVSLILAFLLLLSPFPFYLIPASQNFFLQQLLIPRSFSQTLLLRICFLKRLHNITRNRKQLKGLDCHTDLQETEISAYNEAHMSRKRSRTTIAALQYFLNTLWPRLNFPEQCRHSSFYCTSVHWASQILLFFFLTR